MKGIGIEIFIYKTRNVYVKSIIEVIVDGEPKCLPRSTGHFTWDRIRKDIFKFAKFCNLFLSIDYVFATPDGEKHEAARIAPLYSEWNKPRMIVPDRNVMAIVYNNGATMGYILANQTEAGVYIDVICAKPGYGKILMTAFINEFGDQEIKLSALSAVLSYYQQYGFHFGNKCGESHPNLDAMAKIVKSQGTVDSLNILELEKTYRSRPEVKKLLDTLKSKKLNVYTERCDPSNTSCFAVDGFRMVRCKTRRAHKNWR